ncbi:sensor histidine kinase [Chitinimonas sp. JJ19]|uniref:sensor histidine kinase n=1 Tax=Chitinimonas sp. JJ19 TaxID=3109352 RepID=UPI003001EC2E
MNSLFRPTLIRRVVLALLAAFSLVWLLLLLVMFTTGNSDTELDTGLRDVASELRNNLLQLKSGEEAVAATQTTSNMINGLYQRNAIPSQVLFQLYDQDGRLLYRSAQAAGQALNRQASHIQDQQLLGRRYRVHTVSASRWTLTVAASQVDASWMLQSLAEDLTLYLLIAFPCIALPVWIAVRQGIRPLRQFSQFIAARNIDDLSPITLPVRHEELKPLHHALNQLLDQLRLKVAREHSFVQDAAHELRTPMAVIAAQAHVLTLAATPSERQEAKQQLEHAIARCAHLVQQLLQLARLDPAAPQTLRQVDAAQLLRQEIALQAPKALAKQQELALDTPDHLPCLLAESAFQCVIHNLLDNAIRYTPQGSHIDITLQQTQQSLILSVRDDGPGITAEQQDMVFERFHRGQHLDSSGSGLGLAIVKQAIQRLGGQITLAAGIQGKGCNFTVSIPLHAPEAPPPMLR